MSTAYTWASPLLVTACPIDCRYQDINISIPIFRSAGGILSWVLIRNSHVPENDGSATIRPEAHANTSNQINKITILQRLRECSRGLNHRPTSAETASQWLALLMLLCGHGPCRLPISRRRDWCPLPPIMMAAISSPLNTCRTFGTGECKRRTPTYNPASALHLSHLLPLYVRFHHHKTT